MKSLLALLQGYKTYIVGAIAILYAGAMYWSGGMDLKAAADVVLAALGVMGVRSGITTALVQILLVLGVQLPPSPGQVAIKRAVANAGRVAPMALAVVLALSLFSLQACAVFPQQDPLTVLHETEAGFALAEAAYDGICAVSTPPSFCTDPSSQANYAKAKIALEAAFATADAAIAAGGNVNSASINAVLAAIANDWATYNQIVNTVQMKSAKARGVPFKPVPLAPARMGWLS